jgi:4-diphosphocytidyl-2-C-methyl-D-erythritol kinase
VTADRPRAAFAAAKINLFLHVGPRGVDGYHPIASLMVFADIGDRLALEQPAGEGLLRIIGPFAGDLADTADDNLVTWARAALSPGEAFALALDKQLPIAAGLGGGSADAAATLRLVNSTLAAPLSAARLTELARGLGADVAACLVGRPVLARGRGDRLAPAPAMPVLDAVLVNPGVPSSTADVYGAFDARSEGASADMPALPNRFADAAAVAALVKATRNDLEAPAVRLQPAIGAALGALGVEPETLAARVTGSGATVFALCADSATAARLAARLAGAQPGWWVRACRLGRAPR